MLLNVFALIVVSFRPRVASILAIIGSIGYIVLAFADQAGLVTYLKAPESITEVEIVTVVVLVAVVFFASRVYRERTPTKIRSLAPTAPREPI